MTIQAYPSATRVAHVKTTGELLAGPSEWTAEKTSTGHYTIRHAIGGEDYVVIAQTLITPDQDAAFAAVTEEKGDYLCYRVFNADGTDRDHDVQLVIYT